MLKKAFAAMCLAGLIGCSASMDMDPNGTRYSSDTSYNHDRDTQVTYNSGRNDSASVSTNSDRYDRTYDSQARVASDRDTSASVDTRTDSYSYRSNDNNTGRTDVSYRSGSSADRNEDGPIWTDPVGRPERAARQVQDDLQASASRSGANSYSYSSRNDRDAVTASGHIESDGFATRNDAAVRSSGSSSSSGDVTVRSDATGNLSSQDRAFVDQAANSGLFEVRSSQLAVDRLTDDNAKKFAQQMVDDHTKANNELKAIASRKGVTVRTDLRDQQQRMYDTLSNASGSDLANQYRQQQIQAHEQTIKLFEDEANNGQDSDLKAFAQKTLPTLRQHLEHARSQLTGPDMNK